MQDTNFHQGVSNLRFFAMASIVAVHAFPQISKTDNIVLLALLEFVKFGTIGFFIASGYLLNARSTKNYADFFRARLVKVALPWLFWITIHAFVMYQWLNFKGIDIEFPKFILNELFSTSYWFVLNFFIASWIYLKTCKIASSCKMLFYYFLLSGVYAFNNYTQWFYTSHTKAIFGFVLFIHVGTLIRLNENYLKSIFYKFRYLLFIILLFFYFGAIWESIILRNIGNPDSLNTLRITNQVYSVIFSIFLVTQSTRLIPKFLNERNTTFGIYLIHVFAVALAYKILQYCFGEISDSWNLLNIISWWIATFLMGYSLSICTLNIFIFFKLGQLVGVR
jgi:hypothetical protein